MSDDRAHFRALIGFPTRIESGTCGLSAGPEAGTSESLSCLRRSGGNGPPTFSAFRNIGVIGFCRFAVIPRSGCRWSGSTRCRDRLLRGRWWRQGLRGSRSRLCGRHGDDIAAGLLDVINIICVVIGDASNPNHRIRGRQHGDDNPDGGSRNYVAWTRLLKPHARMEEKSAATERDGDVSRRKNRHRVADGRIVTIVVESVVKHPMGRSKPVVLDPSPFVALLGMGRRHEHRSRGKKNSGYTCPNDSCAIREGVGH